jgi:hypothetical protein
VAPAIEIARFTVKEGAEEAMLAERPAMVRALRKHFPAHQDAFLTKLDDGSWMDVVLWSDRAQAEAAAEGVYAHPEIAVWFRHTDQVLGFEYADVHQVDRPDPS